MVFDSTASNLVPGDTNGVSDVFVRQLGRTPFTFRVSVGLSGAQANGASYLPSISADGRYVAFHSKASNLVTSDTNNQPDVFVYDRVTKNTIRASQSRVVSGVGNGGSTNATISDDGDTIAFESSASDLVYGDTNANLDAFVYTRSTKTLVMASVHDSGKIALHGGSIFASPSADGKFVTYASAATNLVDDDTNGMLDIFVTEKRSARTVFPTVATNRFGNRVTDSPFGAGQIKLQQVAYESFQRPMNVRQISFRRGNAGSNTTVYDQRIELSMFMGGARLPHLSDRFAANWTGPIAQAISRKQFALPDWRKRRPSVGGFDLALPLDTPFVHTGTDYLLWEMSVYANTKPYTLGLIDMHAETRTQTSTSRVLGSGCRTVNGTFDQALLLTSSGAASSLRVGTTAAPSTAPLSLALGVTNPALSLPAFCTTIYTNPILYLPVGTSSSRGVLNKTLSFGPWDTTWRNLVLHTQLWSPVGSSGSLSHGVRLTLPGIDPGPLVGRLFAPNLVAATGTPESAGAVFRLDY